MRRDGRVAIVFRDRIGGVRVVRKDYHQASCLSRPSSCCDAHLRLNTANRKARDAVLTELVFKVGVDERVVIRLADHQLTTARRDDELPSRRPGFIGRPFRAIVLHMHDESACGASARQQGVDGGAKLLGTRHSLRSGDEYPLDVDEDQRFRMRRFGHTNMLAPSAQPEEHQGLLDPGDSHPLRPSGREPLVAAESQVGHVPGDVTTSVGGDAVADVPEGP